MAVGRYTRGMRLWSVIYPVFLYFAVCQILSVVQSMLPFLAGWDAVMRQGVDTLGGLLVLYAAFLKKEHAGGEPGAFGKTKSSFAERMDRICVLPEHTVADNKDSCPERMDGRKTNGRTAIGCLIAALMLGCGSFALNNLLALTDLMQRSQGYQYVEQSFYSSVLFWEIAVLCILTPIAEELLYRRIVFGELRSWLGRWGAVFVSALLFGVMHMNMVQMIYALGLGLLLGILMECYRDVRVAVCGHITANLLSVLRSELSWLTGISVGSASYWLVTAAALAVALGLVVAVCMRNRSVRSAHSVRWP